ncbi:MAG: hypothetical protein KDC54_02670, partial [Lewinella sp.]|nr:hypothetical protein [Lewinella sp.]
MRYYLTLFVFLAGFGGLAGQAALQHATTTADEQTACQRDCLLAGRVPFAGQAPFFSYYLTWTDGPLAAEIRFTADERS